MEDSSDFPHIQNQDNSYPFEKTWVESAYDGDELLTSQQKHEIQIKKRVKRKFRRVPIFLWPKGIVPYKFSSGKRRLRDSNTSKNVSLAMSYIEKWTCINFLDIQAEKEQYQKLIPELNHSSYLVIESAYSCASNIGFPGDGQIAHIFLNETIGCALPGIVVHEFGHILGFLHEQSRSDRDEFVVVNWQNVIPGLQLNFQRANTDNLAPYDYGSAMHYSAKAFSKNGKDTISSRDPLLNFLMGRRSGFSFYDAMSINRAYHCKENCSSLKSCQNDGFLLNCRCICPQYFKGSRCQIFSPLSATKVFNKTCCKFVELTKDHLYTVASPNHPESYVHSQCSYFFKGPEGAKLNVSMYINGIPYNNSTYKCYHWLEIRYTLIGQRGPRFCGRNSSYTLTSRDNWLLVVFRGRDTEHAGSGFVMNISVVDESGGHVNPTNQNSFRSSSPRTTSTKPTPHTSMVTKHSTRNCQNVTFASTDCFCVGGFVDYHCDRLENISCNFELSRNTEFCIQEQWKNNGTFGDWILNGSGALIVNTSISDNAVIQFPKIHSSKGRSRMKCLQIKFELIGNGSLAVNFTSSIWTNRTSTWTASEAGIHYISFSIYAGNVFEVKVIGCVDDTALDMVSIKVFEIQNGPCSTSPVVNIWLTEQTNQLKGLKRGHDV